MNKWQCTLSKGSMPHAPNVGYRTFTCQADELRDLADNGGDLAHLLHMQPGDVFRDRAGDRWVRLS